MKFREVKEKLSEAVNLRDELSPPYMLILKRMGIRIFPDGRKVALYVNEKLGLTFTIPYGPSETNPREVMPGIQAEEFEYIEENIEHIKNISRKGKSKEIKFLDGSSFDVHPNTAKAIHLVWDGLNDQNKAKIASMLSHSKGKFLQVADFAHKHVDYRIGKHSS